MIRKKFLEKRGATIVFALGVLLASTLISVAVISIALNSAKTVARQRDSYQSDLALSSAASYVRMLFNGCSYSYDEGSGEYVVGYGPAGVSESELGKLSEKEKESFGDSSFEAEFKALVAGAGNEMTWYISSGADPGEDPLRVKISAKNDDNNNIEVVLSDGREGIAESEINKSTVKLFFAVSSEENGIGGKDYTWSDCSIETKGN